MTEIEFANQQSLDTPEAYLEAIALAQTNLFTHASSAMREMDEKEFEKVMGSVEKVMQHSPVFDSYSMAEGDFEVKKFSEEEYAIQSEWHEENREDYLDAFSPIIPQEYLMEIESLTTEFFAVYGGADVDTTGWRTIMHRASQDALAQETLSLGCSSPQQITVNQASILSVPSIATIMGWFSTQKQVVPGCLSCCLECCRCADGCERAGQQALIDRAWESLGAGASCIGVSVVASLGLSIGPCAIGALIYYDVMLFHSLYSYFRCRGDCRGMPHCVRCPEGIENYESGTNCESAHRW